jgi:hypothetical protein
VLGEIPQVAEGGSNLTAGLALISVNRASLGPGEGEGNETPSVWQSGGEADAGVAASSFVGYGHHHSSPVEGYAVGLPGRGPVQLAPLARGVQAATHRIRVTWVIVAELRRETKAQARTQFSAPASVSSKVVEEDLLGDNLGDGKVKAETVMLCPRATPHVLVGVAHDLVLNDYLALAADFLVEGLGRAVAGAHETPVAERLAPIQRGRLEGSIGYEGTEALPGTELGGQQKS